MMEENWISIGSEDDMCRLSFNNVDILLDEDDVSYLRALLERYQLFKVLERCIA